MEEYQSIKSIELFLEGSLKRGNTTSGLEVGGCECRCGASCGCSVGCATGGVSAEDYLPLESYRLVDKQYQKELASK